jgi:two-component system chemotaxis response regulator CheY
MSLIDCNKGAETILIVDDEVLLRKFFSDILVSQGFNVILAEDGECAVAEYFEKADEIDIVLMDITMPRKDGITAYKEIKEFDADAKILLMSAYSKLSFDGLENLNFIQKPMSLEKLYQSIRDVLDFGTLKPENVLA